MATAVGGLPDFPGRSPPLFPGKLDREGTMEKILPWERVVDFTILEGIIGKALDERLQNDVYDALNRFYLRRLPIREEDFAANRRVYKEISQAFDEVILALLSIG
jgi:hypothetical protein